MKRTPKRVLILLTAAALITVAGLGFYAFERKTRNASENYILAQLSQSGETAAAVLDEALSGRVSAISALANASSALTEPQIKTLLTESAPGCDVTYLGYADEAEQYYWVGGEKISFPPEAQLDLLAAARNGQAVVDFGGALDDQSAGFVLVAPVYAGEVFRGAVLGYLANEDIRNLLDRCVDNAGRYAFITKPDGRILAHSHSTSYIPFTNSTLDFYREATLEYQTVDEIEANLRDGRAGALAYEYGNQHRFVAYQRLKTSPYIFFTVFSGSQAEAYLTESIGYARHLLLFGLGWAVLFMLWLVLAFALQKHERNEDKRQIQMLEDTIGRVTELSRSILFRVDMRTGNIAYNSAFTQHFGRDPIILNIDHFSENCERFFEEDVSMWHKLGEELKKAAPQAKISARLRHADGSTDWYSVYFVTIYQKDKRPFCIVGRIERIEDTTNV